MSSAHSYRPLVIAELILHPFRRFTYVTAHSPTLMLLHLRYSSFSNPSFASPTSQALHLIDLASRPWFWVLRNLVYHRCTRCIREFATVLLVCSSVFLDTTGRPECGLLMTLPLLWNLLTRSWMFTGVVAGLWIVCVIPFTPVQNINGAIEYWQQLSINIENFVY